MTRRRRTYRKPGHQAPQAPRTEVIAPTPRRRRNDRLHDDPASDDYMVDDYDDGADLGDLYLQIAVHGAALIGLGLQVHRIHKNAKRKKLTP